MSIDEARAKVWLDDVNHELQAVRALLKKVQTANTEVAGSDDTIMEGIYQVGVAMDNAWSQMCNIFDEVQEKLNSTIAKIREAVREKVEEITALKGKF